MRVLHLFANYKWTGPADPAIRTALRQRAAGAAVTFAEAQWTLPQAEHRVRIELDRTDLPRLRELQLRKHFHPAALWRDAGRLAERLRAREFDVLHAHLPADHLVAALAIRRARVPVLLVRTLYDPHPPRTSLRTRWSFRRTGGFVVPTAGCAEQLAHRFRIPSARILLQDPPVEPRNPERADWRARHGLRSDAVLIGITARIQPHRRFDLLWEVAARVTAAEPRVRFVLLGRGNPTDMREQVTEPIARHGIGARVLLPGYLYEPDYGQALANLDLFLFLVPGSDGTCRAVREVMTLGVPVVATPRGVLPDLLAEGGIIAAEEPAALADALLELVRDPARAARLGAAGQHRTRTAMDPAAAAARLLAFYRQLREAGS